MHAMNFPCSKILNKRSLLNVYFRYYSVNSSIKKICIVGSGPAGFYSAQHILKNKQTEIDIYEKLPVPFGLIRYGVAPDHPEIKSVTNSFTKIALDKRCNFYGNINVGEDVTLSELLSTYHAVILAYGASKDKVLGIPGEEAKNVISARKFVGWYNGHPDHVHEPINLDVESATVVGHGNVALDVARILLRQLEDLKTTDISDHAYEKLKKSKVQKVVLVGRRGPLQVAFTIKELREMINLPGCQTLMHLQDFERVSDIIPSLQRPRKRLLELMYDTASSKGNKNEKVKTCEIKFYRSPKSIVCDAEGRVKKLIFKVNKVDSTSEYAKVIQTDEEDEIECGLVSRSVGYQTVPIDSNIPFDEKKYIIPNNAGRVVGKKGLYCSGWVKTGPIGVILSTMHGSYETGENVLEDINKGDLSSRYCAGSEMVLDILKNKGVKFTTFDDWLNMDKIEQERGKAIGKSRRKICSIEEMLKTVNKS